MIKKKKPGAGQATGQEQTGHDYNNNYYKNSQDQIRTAISGRKPKSDGEVRTECPFCTGGQKNTLCVNMQTGLYHCKRCHVAGNYLKVNGGHKKLFARWLFEDQAIIRTSHPYVDEKQIKPKQIKVDQYENWIVPFQSQAGDIQTIQFIKPDGDKFFLSKKKNSGQGPTGSAYRIKGTNDLIYVCEGAATGHSIHEATGATVYCVGGCNNFKDVLPWIIKKHGNVTSNVILAADTGNGFLDAKKAAQKNKTRLCSPVTVSDFNDLAVEHGHQAVKDILESAEIPKPEAEEQEPGEQKPKIEVISVAEIMAINPQIEVIAEGFLNRGEPMILHAAGGVGKSTIAQQMAYELARPDNMLGNMLLENFAIKQPKCQSLFVQSENTMAAVNMKAASWDVDIAERIFYPKIFDDVLTTGESFEDPRFIQKVVDTIHVVEDKTCKRLDVLFVDPLISFHGAEENEAGDMRAALDGLTRVSQETKITPIVLHHDNRNDGYRGSSAINDWCRTRIHMVRTWICQDRITDFAENDQPILRTAKIPAIEIHHAKANNMREFEPFTMVLSKQLRFVKVDEPMNPEAQERCLEVQQALKDIGGFAQSNALLARAISELTGRSITTCKKNIADAVKNNLITAEKTKSTNGKGAYSYILKE